jgi:tocopherol O-methyltransferase
LSEPRGQSSPETAARVADYYNRNTRAFLLHARQSTGAIHRELWAPGVVSRDAALTYVNQLLADRLPRQGALLDLGCGVGGTAVWLGARRFGPVLGVTNSPLQARIGAERVSSQGLATQVEIRLGSYLKLEELGVQPAGYRGAYAIESFVHSPDVDLFFASVGAALALGGTLIVCDDFVDPTAQGRKARRVLARVRAGWLAASLVTPAAAIASARVAGFELHEQQDLTPMHRFHGRGKRLWMKLVTALPVPHPFWRSLRGGLALQIALERRWLRHLLLVFVKQPD